MRDDEWQIEEGEHERASREPPPRQDVRERRPTEDCPEGRGGRGDERQRERFAQLLVAREPPDAGNSTGTDKPNERCEEKEQEERGQKRADDGRRRREG